MRWCIYLHLAAVAICVAFSLADRGLFISHQASKFLFERLGPLLLPALIAWFACPTAAVISWKRVRRSQKIGYGLIAEVLLAIGQLLAMLPGVM